LTRSGVDRVRAWARAGAPEDTNIVGEQTSRGRRLLRHAALIAFAFLMMYPLLWLLAGSFRPIEEIFTDPSLIPSSFSFDNYVDGWTAFRGVTFGRFFLNSFLVSGLSIVGNLVACSMAAFAFARLEFRFKKALFAIMLMTVMLPYHVTVIPQYIAFLNIGWINTYWPLIVPKFLGTDAFFIFLMVQFIRGLPRELDQAAAVDGAGPWQIYWRIIMPLSLPALATTAIFTFIWTYNDFFGPLLYLTRIDLLTVPLGLRLFLDATGDSAWGPMFAMSILSLGPIFGFFLASQRLLVQGIATTGIK
jgi:multiple sugar transport system permease protein